MMKNRNQLKSLRRVGGRMIIGTTAFTLVSLAALAAESGASTLTSGGWTIETQDEHGRLTIKHEPPQADELRRSKEGGEEVMGNYKLRRDFVHIFEHNCKSNP